MRVYKYIIEGIQEETGLTMEEQKVSVVVTCYNHDKYIEQCLRSVFAQTHKNIELFVFNDGSIDRSGEIIENVLVDSPLDKTQYFYHENMGVVKTKNKALLMVSGDFILFVDSDNFLDRDYIEKLLKCANKTNADIVYCDLYDPDKQEFFSKTKEYSLEELFKGNFIDTCSLVRHSIVGNVKEEEYLNDKKMNDFDFFLQLIVYNGAKPQKCHDTKLNYRVLDNSRARTGKLSYTFEIYFYVVTKYLKFYPEIVQKAFKFNLCNLADSVDGLLEQIQERDGKIQEKDKKIQDCAKRYGEVVDSKSWKIGRFITFPLRKMKELIKG
ncbi:MAG: glycosyltransferase family 2 protein [Lactobacillales bacterium]|jgi:glycosyltransferase involved in cell wall biosynthesis|nr:glycosyltransferase family 2 protein [Lactobacillales bacterium]